MTRTLLVIGLGLMLCFGQCNAQAAPTLSERTFKHLSKAQGLMGEDEFEEAEEILLSLDKATAGRAYPNAVVQQTLGYLYSMSGRYDKAKSSFAAAINSGKLPIEPTQSLRANLARLYIADAETQHALPLLAAWFTDHEGEPNADMHVLYGSAFAQLNRYPEAITQFERAVSIAPKPKADWFRILAAMYADQKNYAKAAKNLEALVVLEPDNKQSWKQLSGMYMADQKDTQALDVLSTAFHKGMLTTADEMENLSKFYAYKEDPFAAAQTLRASMDNGFSKPSYKLYRRLGNFWLQAKENNKAIGAFRSALEFKPNDVDAHRYLASIYLESEDWAELKALLQPYAPEGDSDKGRRALMLGIAHFRLGDPASAKSSLNRAQDYTITAPSAGQWLAYIDDICPDSTDNTAAAGRNNVGESSMTGLTTGLRSLCGGAMLAVASTAASAAELIPLEHFTKNSQIQDIKISPTGDHLATTVPLGNRTNLVILDRKSMKPINSFKFGLNEHVYNYFWANDTRLVIRTAFRYGSLSDWDLDTGDIFSADFDGGNDRFIYGPRAKGKGKSRKSAGVLDPLPGDDEHVLISTHTYVSHRNTKEVKAIVYKLNIYNGRLTRHAVSPVKNAHMLVDPKGQVRVAVGSDDELSTKVMYRASHDEEWRVIDQYAYGKGGMLPLEFYENSNKFFVKSNHDHTLPGLFEFDPDSGEKRLLYRHELVDFEPFIKYDEATKKSSLVGTFIMPDRASKVYLDSELSAVDIAFDNLFPDDYVKVTGRSADKMFSIVRVTSDRNPGEFYLFDKQKNSLTYLASRRPWIDPVKMATKKPFSFKARDGLTLHGYLTLPSGKKAEKLPMIVHPHGGPHGPRDGWFFSNDVQLLASRGYAVLQVNFRGSGGYGLDFENAGHGEWGGLMQDDLTDATRWAVENGIAAEDRICIYGGSYGGYAALMGVVKEPDLYQCAIGHVGVYDLEFMKSTGNVAERMLGGKVYMDKVMGTDPDKLKRTSPAHGVDAIKAAVMIVHGGQDLQAHYKNAYILRDAMKKAGKPYEWAFYPKEGHGFMNEDNRLDFRQKMLAFLAKHIGN
ncbi:MAG: prolyl oligopeptidase family serine peptidase [Halieaceae bacterium]|jgi:dipeptidyl aminopeptidase/acylaminoacyl peptidase/tetratricopeptide (TPR) repeat protein|nr:prolyl oligopeptidase family serine peptidase [Halieaceae bacterium]